MPISPRTQLAVGMILVKDEVKSVHKLTAQSSEEFWVIKEEHPPFYRVFGFTKKYSAKNCESFYVHEIKLRAHYSRKHS